MYRIGIDFGGTKIEGIVLDPDGKELHRKRIPTMQSKGYHFILAQIDSLYKELVQQVSGKEHTLGIGTPGAISPQTGLLKNSNTVCLNEKPFAQDLEKKLGRSFSIQNDANCFAMAEALHGAGAGKKLVFGVIMGTGCGGGIVYNGEVWLGRQAIAGEWGHTVIDPQGPKCYCGARGCVETLISGGGLERLYESSFGTKLLLAEIVEKFRSGDQQAAAFIRRFFENFGQATANLINILDPDIIILGGGVSNIKELYTQGIEEVRKRIFSDNFETLIVQNTLGDSAGVIGAALIGV